MRAPTVSEAAVLRAVRGGATTVYAIQQTTGAAAWWLEACIDSLIRGGRLRRDRATTELQEIR